MIIRLRKDVLLVAGSADNRPVDLVLSKTRQRVPLTPDEAAVAMLLVDGVEEASLVELAQQHMVEWESELMTLFISRLDDISAVQRIASETGNSHKAVPLLESVPLPESALGELSEDESFGDDPTQIDRDGALKALLQSGISGLAKEPDSLGALAALGEPPPRELEDERPTLLASGMVDWKTIGRRSYIRVLSYLRARRRRARRRRARRPRANRPRANRVRLRHLPLMPPRQRLRVSMPPSHLGVRALGRDQTSRLCVPKQKALFVSRRWPHRQTYRLQPNNRRCSR
jgi:hypothetical protein